MYFFFQNSICRFHFIVDFHMPLKVDDIFEGYKVSKVVVTDLFKEIYTGRV